MSQKPWTDESLKEFLQDSIENKRKIIDNVIMFDSREPKVVADLINSLNREIARDLEVLLMLELSILQKKQEAAASTA